MTTRNRLTAWTLTAVSVVALAGCGADEDATDTLTVTGVVRLTSGQFTWTTIDTSCAGKGGYDDLVPGAQVVVTDADGATIGLGQLDAGKTEPGDVDPRVPGVCNLPFTVAGVPAGHAFYAIEVTHRGRVQYPEDKIAGPLTLTIG